MLWFVSQCTFRIEIYMYIKVDIVSEDFILQILQI